MADSTLAVTLNRTDNPETPVVRSVVLTPDAGNVEGPGRITLAAGAGSTENTLWTGVNNANGSAFTARAFDRLVIVVDPENALADDDTDPDNPLGVWVLLYYTAIAGGSSTSTGVRFFVKRNAPFIVPSSIAASGVTITREITKVTAFNANASLDVTVQVVVEAPAD